jgi:hypothetical protein
MGLLLLKKIGLHQFLLSISGMNPPRRIKGAGSVAFYNPDGSKIRASDHLCSQLQTFFLQHLKAASIRK